MGKYYCDYCDIYLTHDSMNARKAHNTGRNHVSNVRDYFAGLGHDKAQNIIDAIVQQHETGGRAQMMAAPSMRIGAGFMNPMPMNMPPFPGGMPPPPGGFPAQGSAPPPFRPPFPPTGAPGAPPGMPPFPPPNMSQNMSSPPPPGGGFGAPPGGAMPPFPPPGGRAPASQSPNGMSGSPAPGAGGVGVGFGMPPAPGVGAGPAPGGGSGNSPHPPGNFTPQQGPPPTGNPGIHPDRLRMMGI